MFPLPETFLLLLSSIKKNVWMGATLAGVLYVQDIFSRQYIFRLSKPPLGRRRRDCFLFVLKAPHMKKKGKKKALDAEEGVVKAERREFRRPFLCFRAYVMIFHLCKSLDGQKAHFLDLCTFS